MKISKIPGMFKKLWHLYIYKPGTKKIYWEKIISSTVVVVSFLIWAYFNQIRVNKLKAELNRHGKYTVGITTASYKNVKGSRYIHYKYSILGKEYKNSKQWPFIDNSVYTKGGYYLVKFDSTNFTNAEIYFKCPVSANIKPPEGGWIKRPFNCSEKK